MQYELNHNGMSAFYQKYLPTEKKQKIKKINLNGQQHRICAQSLTSFLRKNIVIDFS